MPRDFTPTCRYKHGDLVKVQFPNIPPWGFVAMGNANIGFTGTIFACPTCGYTEFFDDEIESTVEELAKK